MNTKKIIAISMAATTAFSMFGAAMSVNAGWAGTPPVYSWDSGVANSYTDAYKQIANIETQKVAPLTSGKLSEATVLKISFDAPTDSNFEFDEDLYYVSDWMKVADVKDATLDTFKDAVIAYQDAYNANKTDPTLGTKLTAINTALAPAYMLNDVTAANATGIVLDLTSTKYVDAYAKTVTIYNDIKKFFSGPNVDAAEVGKTYDEVDFDNYDAELLFKDIKAVYEKAISTTTTDKPNTSRMLYVNNAYAYIQPKLEAASKDTLIEQYDRLFETVSSLVEEDYKAADWTKVAYNLNLAEVQAGANEWQKAIDALKEALKVSPIAGVNTDLQNALMSCYDKGTTKVTKGDIKNSVVYQDTTDANYKYVAYRAADYKEYRGQTDEWMTFIGDDIDFVKMDGTTKTVEGAYGYAYEVYSETTKVGAKIPQSRIDAATTMLNDALAELTSTSTTPAWKLVQLESVVDLAASLDEADFSTSSRKWKEFETALAKAETVLAKTNPSTNEITSVTNTLNNATKDLKSAVKTATYALTKEHRDTLAEARRELKNIADQTGAQYVTLQKVIALADDVASSKGTNLDAINSSTPVSLISDYENSIAELEKAIAGFTQPQGWYQDGGKWFYGEDDSFYVDGWKQIGKTWFYFNADGSAKQNEWLQLDGSWYYFNSNCGAATGWAKVDNKWYFFKGNNVMKTGWEKVDGNWYYMDGSGAMVTGWAQIGGKYYYFAKTSNALGQMAANTTIDGYKLDANGVWVK